MIKHEELEEKKWSNEKKMFLIETACDDLLSYGLWDGKTKIKNFIKKYLLLRQVGAEDVIFWPTGLLAAGIWQCRQRLLAMQKAGTAPAGSSFWLQQIETSLAAYFTRWEKRRYPIYYLDDLLSGEVFLAAYAQFHKDKTGNGIIQEKNAEKYRKAVEKMAEFAFTYPTDETGSFPYRASQGNGHIYVDVLGMTSPFLYSYARFSGKDEGMELGVRQIANFLAYGMDAATGLPYHGYNMKTGEKHGIIGWGRAVGWLLRGMMGCMSTVYGAERLQEAYCDLIDAAIVWQRKDGFFSWQLQAMEGTADVSATAMICLAIQEGLKTRMIQGDAYQEALAKGIHAIKKSVKYGRVDYCLGECEGFAMYPQKYGQYPWGHAVTLLLDGIMN